MSTGHDREITTAIQEAEECAAARWDRVVLACEALAATTSGDRNHIDIRPRDQAECEALARAAGVQIRRAIDLGGLPVPTLYVNFYTSIAGTVVDAQLARAAELSDVESATEIYCHGRFSITKEEALAVLAEGVPVRLVEDAHRHDPLAITGTCGRMVPVSETGKSCPKDCDGCAPPAQAEANSTP